MKFGVCYYPEHWPEARWAEDARWLKALGVTTVRLAEFAWSRMEAEPGRFTWGWLDRAVKLFVDAGFEVILGTPTAAPPVWLSRLDPSTLPVDDQGRRRNYGGRRHYCPNNLAYRDHTRRIVQAMAERYGAAPGVVGWQIDNEFGGGNTARCYCPVCETAFRRWLAARYSTLAALNTAWGTVFWSAEFDDWSQIGAPILNLAKPNAAHVLDYYRFCSDSIVAYQQFQIDLLRAAVGDRHFITHNFMGLYPDLNYFDLARSLDFVTWDSYPTGNADRWRPMLYGDEKPPAFAYDVGDPYITGFAHDLTRGLLGRPFWIMEQQAGHVNWGYSNPLIRPGTVRLWVWQAVASGADALVVFRERAALAAQEKYHSGLQHHDGRPDVGYYDLERLRGEQARLAALTTAPPRAQVALLWNYDDLWALQLEPHTREFTYLRHLFVYYRALQRLGVPVDVAPPGRDLTGYRCVIAPTAHLVAPELAGQLTEYVTGGGALVLGVRSGFKNSANTALPDPLPGLLRELVGATVTDWGALPAGVAWEVAAEVAGLSGGAGLWVETLDPGSAQALATYATGPYAGRAALTVNAVGAGQAWYCGWHPSLEQAMALAGHLAERLGLERLASDLPAGLVAARRGAHTVLLNFTDAPLTGEAGGQRVAVPGREVAWLGAE